jgi:hypothetical protein
MENETLSAKPVKYGGILLFVTLPGEAAEIKEDIAEDRRFSKGLSNRDVVPRGCELCILAFEEGVLHSLWLVRFATNAKHESARCRGLFVKCVSLIIRRHYNAKVDKSKWKDCRSYNAKALNEMEQQKTDAFNRWVTPSNLSHLRVAHFSEMRDIGRKGLQKLDQELRHLGITTLLHGKY